MHSLELTITTPERVVYQDSVESLLVPTKDGLIEVLPQHVGLVSVLAHGEMIAKKDGNLIPIAVYKGVLEVKQASKVFVLADSAEHVDELDAEAIKQAKERVEKILAEKEGVDDIEYARFAELLSRELSRLTIAEKYHK